MQLPMKRDRLVLMGTKGGPSVRRLDRMPTSSLLDIGGRKCVIDCGLGVTRGLINAGVQLRDIDQVYITHLHSDHVIELGPMLHSAWTTGLDREISVYGPNGTAEYLDGFFSSLRFDIELRLADEGRPDIRDMVRLTEYREGDVHSGDAKVSALWVPHPPVTECYALKFESGGWRVTFSSDTSRYPPLAEFAKGSDILVHEAMLSKGVDWLVKRTTNAKRLREHLMASHTEAADVGEIAKRAGVKQLVLHHLVPCDCPEINDSDWLAEVRRTWDGNVAIGRDGMEFWREGE